MLAVTVPTFRPDIRPGLEGEADIAEEVARIYGYSRIPRRTPSWPQPGRLTHSQRDRRLVKEILVGLGASEAWTPTFLSEADQLAADVSPPYVEVTNPLVESERYLRSSLVPGLLRAVRFNADRRQPDVALFEVGKVFAPIEGPPANGDRPPVEEVERLSVIFAGPGQDAWTAMAAWQVVADALRIEAWSLDQSVHAGTDAHVLHPSRSGTLCSVADGADGRRRATPIGVVGELDPSVVAGFGLVGVDGRPRRMGWLDLDLDTLLDRQQVARRSDDAQPVSRYPSADIDLALVVEDSVPAAMVAETLERAVGDVSESVELFDVYRGPGVGAGRRSLAYRLRFAALDRTLTDEEMAAVRERCIAAAAAEHGAALRQ